MRERTLEQGQAHYCWNFDDLEFIVKKFDANQPRDENGRWTDGGSTPELTFEKPASLGGAHYKEFWKDKAGNRWMFKPAKGAHGGPEQVPMMAHGEALGYQLAQVMRPDALQETHAVTLRGQLGSAHKMLYDLKTDHLPNPEKLTPDEIKQVQQEQVKDWLMSNHDSHAGQFLETKDRTIIGIDKAQAFRYFPNDRLDVNYHPNERYGTDDPYYNHLFRAVKEGRVKFDPNDTLPAIERMEKVPNDRYREMLKPYADSREKFSRENGMSFDKQDFLREAVRRKENLRRDFEKFYSGVLGKPFHFGQKIVSKAVEGPEAPTPTLTPTPKATNAPASAFPGGIGSPARLVAVVKGGRIEIRKEFDPNQPRDDQGRWTRTGSESGQGSGSGYGKSHAEAAAYHAQRLLNTAKEVEPHITDLLLTTASEYGGKMEGLDFRLKSEESLKRKLITKATERGTSVDQEAEKIGDALRYTMVLDHTRYADGAAATIEGLRQKGMDIFESENYWVDDDDYNGIHVAFRAKNGLKVELQLHTPESFDLKMSKLHQHYEVARDINRSPEERYSAWMAMVNLSKSIPKPRDVHKVCCPARHEYKGPMPERRVA